MNKTLEKILAIVLLVTMVAGLSACFEETGFGNESASYSTQNTIPVYKRLFFDVAQNPYYATLKDNEKNVYSLIFEGLYKGSRKFECPVKTNAEELSLAIDAVLNDHPLRVYINIIFFLKFLILFVKLLVQVLFNLVFTV